MYILPENFIKEIKSGKSERSLNLLIDPYFDSDKIKELIRNGHTLKSAKEHLSTDWSDGYTICNKCGSYYHLGKGFTKHLSTGCLHCEGEEKHRVYWVNASSPEYGGFSARYMSIMFDDRMSYCKGKLQIEKFKALL
jgi:hypothetical protein